MLVNCIKHPSIAPKINTFYYYVQYAQYGIQFIVNYCLYEGFKQLK